MLEVDPSLLEQRRRLGLDRWDEMWEGVLHMSPAPAREHQRVLTELLVFLVTLLRRTARGTILPGINVFNEASPSEDYRIPDLTFVAAGREPVFAEDGTRAGGPDAVIEIRSPGDESYDKLPFFGRLGIREVIVVDRDTKRVDILALEGDGYVPRIADANRGLISATLGVSFTTFDGRLLVADVSDPSVCAEI